MQGFAELIEEECAGCPGRLSQQYFRRIRTAANRMDQLITDALNYSRAVRQEIPMEKVDVGELLQDLVDTYPNLQPDQADIFIQPNLPPVLGNEAALTQCFSNLLGNAVKFAKPGVKPVVRVWAEPAPPAQPGQTPRAVPTSGFGASNGESGNLRPLNEKVRIWVEDNGVGIAKHYQHHIFGIFQRGGTEHEGTGIGLAIVQKVAQRMGGEVGVESEEGAGSRFWVELQQAP